MEIPSWFEFLKKSPLDLDLFNRESGARTEHYLLALPFLMVEHQSVLAKLRNCQISYSLLLLFGPSFWTDTQAFLAVYLRIREGKCMKLMYNIVEWLLTF